ncbi:ABC transporter permease, partial [Comamonas aquatica]|nr:ABC transporter permease [Comamonas aquatica]
MSGAQASWDLPLAPASALRPARVWRQGLVAALAWALLGALTWLWPNKEIGFSDWAYTAEFAALSGVLALALALAALTLARPGGR